MNKYLASPWHLLLCNFTKAAFTNVIVIQIRYVDAQDGKSLEEEKKVFIECNQKR